jgi:hypothetical protein
MTDPAAQEWPNHRLKVMVPMWSLLTVSTAFLVWRIAYGIKSRRRFLVCDYLLIVACVSVLSSKTGMHVVLYPQKLTEIS